jgi:hypothetical protein
VGLLPDVRLSSKRSAEMEEIVDTIQLVFLSLLVLGLGLAFLLVGYRFFLILLPIWGFFAGFWLGAQAMSLLLNEGLFASIIAVVVGVAVGLILAVLSYLFYALGVVLLGATFGFWLGSGLMYAFFNDPGFLATIIGIIFALAFAVLTVLLDFKKHLIIVITAFGGASSILISALLIFGKVSVASLGLDQNILRPVLSDSIIWLVIWLLLIGIGIIIQEMTTRGYILDSEYGSENQSSWPEATGKEP